MWIRSQDKNRLLNVNGFYVNGCVIEYDFDNKFYAIGEYATRERALEVLDEIQKMVIGRVILPPSFTEKQIDEYLKNSFILPEIAFREPQIQQLPIVYEMPKE